METLKDLRETIPLFGDQIQFHLNVKSKPCLFCPREEKERDCISNGLYCPIAPLSKDADLMTYLDTLDGRSLIKQSLLAKCVHMILYEYSNDAVTSIRKGLDYMLYFRENCTQDGDKSKIDDFQCAYD